MRLNLKLILGILIATQLLGVIIFCAGFFPQKNPLKGHSTLDDFPAPLDRDEKRVTLQPKYDRLVMMVIDAFRADFLYGDRSSMNFTRSLLREGRAKSFIAEAQAPTVTLPRIKALTSGGIPSFLDFIFNFMSEALLEDNVITQLYKAGRKIVFFGDDTWLKLFPDHFLRHDGTTSFYVTDTVEVDNNVTRHVEPEIKKNDWDVMILHYLGLDHVGHSGGPYSILMAPKQREMDEIVKQIHTKVLQTDKETGKSTLFLLCSDHGMNEIGNHGGSTDGETSAVMVMSGTFFENEKEPKDRLTFDGKVPQVDLVPTLSLLFGLPIPRNSLGKIVFSLFEKSPKKDILRALQINAHQQIQIMKANTLFWQNEMPATETIENLMQMHQRAEELHKDWITSQSSSHFNESVALYEDFLTRLQEQWNKILSSYDMPLLYTGIALLGIAFIASLLTLTSITTQQNPNETFLLFNGTAKALGFAGALALLGLHFAACTSVLPSFNISDSGFCTKSQYPLVLGSSFLFSFCVAIVATASRRVATKSNVPVNSTSKSTRNFFEKGFLIGGIILHVISLAGSSTVEEEHQVWYFLTTTFFIILFMLHYYREDENSVKFRNFAQAALLLLATRILRGWNQTGNKWLGGPDFAKWFLYAPRLHYLHAVVSGSIIAIALFGIIYSYRQRKTMGNTFSYLYQICCVVACFFLVCYKCNMTVQLLSMRKVVAARWIYLFVITSIVSAVSFPFRRHINNKNQTASSLLKMMAVLLFVSFSLLFILIHRVHNTPTFVLLAVQAFSFLYFSSKKSGEGSVWPSYVAIIWLSEASYFYFGNSNSFATIDISGAYTGLDGYNEVIVGLLVGLIALSGPILFFITGFIHIADRVKSVAQYEWDVLTSCFVIVTIRILVLFAFSIFITILRHHLFIWSVFSPKYIYEVFFTLIDAVKCLLLLGSIPLFRSLQKVARKSKEL